MRILISLAIYLTFIASPALAGSSNFYGSDGAYIGTMQSAGPNNNFIYGSDGNYVGSTARAGNNTFFYGSDGSYLGSATTTGNKASE